MNRTIPPLVLMAARLHPAVEGAWPELVGVLGKPFALADLARVLERHLRRR